MPDLALPDLTKELDIGGRKIPLFVPVVGAGIAVALVVVAKLRGSKASGGGTGAGSMEAPPVTQPSQQPGEPGQPGEPTQPDNTFMSALTQLAGQFEAGQANLAEQIATAQGGIGQLSSAQQALQQQFQTAQQQMGAQAQAFQAGIAGVQSQATRFQADTNTRLLQVERGLANIDRDVRAQANAGPNIQTKKLIADNLGLIITYGINPLNSRAGLSQWQTEFNGQTGSFRWNPGGGWIQVF